MLIFLIGQVTTEPGSWKATVDLFMGNYRLLWQFKAVLFCVMQKYVTIGVETYKTIFRPRGMVTKMLGSASERGDFYHKCLYPGLQSCNNQKVK